MTLEQTNIFKSAAHHRFQWEEAQQSHVILFPEGMVKLNGSAGEVLSLVDGKNSVDQIIASLKIKFKDVEGIEKDILSMIQFALDKAWIEKAN
jgi:pyrroloquinoline quinone biosynthesis protein D